jgi:hypothetical protein
MFKISSQGSALAVSDPDAPCAKSKAISHTVATEISNDQHTELSFGLSGQFMNSVGEPRLAGGQFLGCFAYIPEAAVPQAADHPLLLPNFGRYKLSAWNIRFLDAQARWIGTLSSDSNSQSASTFLNRQVIMIVRPSCVFLRFDGSLECCWGQSDWTLRLLFALPDDNTFLLDDLATSRLVSGETRRVWTDADMPVSNSERVTVANAAIQLQGLWQPRLSLIMPHLKTVSQTAPFHCDDYTELD